MAQSPLKLVTFNSYLLLLLFESRFDQVLKKSRSSLMPNESEADEEEEVVVEAGD